MKNNIRLSGIAPESITDGPGIRLTIFTQGCPHKCDGCHNPETWSMDKGKDYPVTDIINMLKENPLLRGITFSGGEPLIRAAELLPLAAEIKNIKKNIVCYTGYVFEDLIHTNDKNIMGLFNYIDILVDGPFIQNMKDLTKNFTGSTNQRVIDLQKTLKNNEIVLFSVE